MPNVADYYVSHVVTFYCPHCQLEATDQTTLWETRFLLGGALRTLHAIVRPNFLDNDSQAMLNKYYAIKRAMKHIDPLVDKLLVVLKSQKHKEQHEKELEK